MTILTETRATGTLLSTAKVRGHTYAVLIDRDTDTARVSSKSNDGATHMLTSEGCDCDWAKYHRLDIPCAHQIAVNEIHQRARRD